MARSPPGAHKPKTCYNRFTRNNARKVQGKSTKDLPLTQLPAVSKSHRALECRNGGAPCARLERLMRSKVTIYLATRLNALAAGTAGLLEGGSQEAGQLDQIDIPAPKVSKYLRMVPPRSR